MDTVEQKKRQGSASLLLVLFGVLPKSLPGETPQAMPADTGKMPARP